MHKKIITVSTEENTPKSEEDILLRVEEVNDFFTYVEVNDQGGDLKESVPDGEDYVKNRTVYTGTLLINNGKIWRESINSKMICMYRR